MKKLVSLLLICCMLTAMLAACGAEKTEPAAPSAETNTETAAPVTAEPATTEPAQEEAAPVEEEPVVIPCPLEDGVYTAEFHTDSTMFRVNDVHEGLGVLTVENGIMTIHVSLASKSILNLFPGVAEDAQKEGAVLLMPSVDMVTYPDGISDEVHGFDVPVPYLDNEFDLALIGKKGVWYDHKVFVTNAQPLETGVSAADLALADGTYTVDVVLEGGTGKSTVATPCTLNVENGAVTATLVWSSNKYDYMLLDGERYEPVTLEPGSTFVLPVAVFDTAIAVVADTVAMSTPHEIEYTLTFVSASIAAAE